MTNDSGLRLPVAWLVDDGGVPRHNERRLNPSDCNGVDGADPSAERHQVGGPVCQVQCGAHMYWQATTPLLCRSKALPLALRIWLLDEFERARAVHCRMMAKAAAIQTRSLLRIGFDAFQHAEIPDLVDSSDDDSSSGRSDITESSGSSGDSGRFRLRDAGPLAHA